MSAEYGVCPQYKVVEGDTLFEIAKKLNVDQSEGVHWLCSARVRTCSMLHRMPTAFFDLSCPSQAIMEPAEEFNDAAGCSALPALATAAISWWLKVATWHGHSCN